MPAAERLGGGSAREGPAASATRRLCAGPDLGPLTAPCGPDCDGGRGDGSGLGGYFVSRTLTRFDPPL